MKKIPDSLITRWLNRDFEGCVAKMVAIVRSCQERGKLPRMRPKKATDAKQQVRISPKTGLPLEWKNSRTPHDRSGEFGDLRWYAIRPPGHPVDGKSIIIPIPRQWVLQYHGYNPLDDNSPEVLSFGIDYVHGAKYWIPGYVKFFSADGNGCGQTLVPLASETERLNSNHLIHAYHGSQRYIAYINDATQNGDNGNFYIEGHQEPIIHQWRYKDKRPAIAGTDIRKNTFGVEVELGFKNQETLHQRDTFWRDSHNAWKKYGHIMTDGSVPGGQAVEFVTRPANRIPMEREVIPKMAESMWLADLHGENPFLNCPDAGLHVHMGRRQITNLCVRKADLLACNPANWKFLEAVAGRKATDYCRFCQKDPEEAKLDAIGANVAEHNDEWRRRPLNLSNRRTIEWRIWKSPFGMPQKKFIAFVNAAIQFTEAVITWSVVTNLEDCTKWRNFSLWVHKNKSEYPELHARLEKVGFLIKNKRLLK